MQKFALKEKGMLIYNVTTKIEWSIAEEWVQWMKDIHIHEVMNTGCFEKHQFVRLVEVDQEEGPTYAAQYYAASRTLYDDYIKNFAPGFRKVINNTWRNKYIAFRTLMEVVG